MSIKRQLRDLFAALDREIERTHEEDAARVWEAIQRAREAQTGSTMQTTAMERLPGRSRDAIRAVEERLRPLLPTEWQVSASHMGPLQVTVIVTTGRLPATVDIMLASVDAGYQARIYQLLTAERRLYTHDLGERYATTGVRSWTECMDEMPAMIRRACYDYGIME